MDRQIILIKKNVTLNNFNENEMTWTQVTSNPVVWARMRESKGREIVSSDKITYIQETVFTIDSRTDLSVANNRVVYNSIPYNIISIHANDESRWYLDLTCEIIDTETWQST